MKPIRTAAIYALAILSLTAFVTGCSPHTTITIDGQKAAFESEMTPTAEKTVRRFTATEGSLYDKDEIRASLARAGITVDSVSFPKPSSIALGLTLNGLDGLLEKSVSYQKADRTISVSMSSESVHAALAAMPRSMNDYLDLLMAPVFTGESMSASEYVDVIAAAYGKTLADELGKSFFTLTVRCPAPIISAGIAAPATCATEGKQAVFKIPLASLLAMEKSFTARAAW